MKRITQPLFWFSILLYFAFQIPLYVWVQTAEYDEAIYLNVARSISKTGLAMRTMGEGFLHVDHPTLYQHGIGLLYYFWGDQTFVFRLLTSIAGAGILVVVWRIVKGIKDEWSAFVAVIILAVNPFFHRYAFFIREEISMCLFILLAIFNLMKDHQDSNQKKHIYWISAWLGLAFLTKELSLIFSAFAILYLFLTGTNLKDRLFRAVVPTTGVAVGFGVWVTWIYLVDPSRFRAVFSRWAALIAGGSGGGGFDVQVAAGWLKIITTSILTPTMVAIFLIGCLMLVYQSVRSKSADRFIWFVALYPFFAVAVSLLISLKRDRHIMPIIFVTAIAIGLTIDWQRLFSWTGKSVFRSSLALLVAGLILFEMSPVQIPENWNRFDQYWEDVYFQRLIINDRHYGVLQQAGVALGEKTAEDEIIVVVNEGPVVGYYADRHYLFLYTEKYDQIIEHLKHAEWLVADADIYLKLANQEKEELLKIIDCGFDLNIEIIDPFRRIEILRKNETIQFETCLPG
ncbi:MAG: 4-amino-4-deoxy-L-arabinose transferase-like glycosyltransferase [Candidatus Promineifilaceae bacterium]